MNCHHPWIVAALITWSVIMSALRLDDKVFSALWRHIFSDKMIRTSPGHDWGHDPRTRHPLILKGRVLSLQLQYRMGLLWSPTHLDVTINNIVYINVTVDSTVPVHSNQRNLNAILCIQLSLPFCCCNLVLWVLNNCRCTDNCTCTAWLSSSAQSMQLWLHMPLSMSLTIVCRLPSETRPG